MRGAADTVKGYYGPELISIHAPHAGSGLADLFEDIPAEISIHAPHAGSGVISWTAIVDTDDFNPRSPCGERQGRLSAEDAMKIFQSTLPMRGAAISSPRFHYGYIISIHAPHAGSGFAVRWL